MFLLRHRHSRSHRKSCARNWSSRMQRIPRSHATLRCLSTTDSSMGDFKTPSQLSPPLPFDSIILVFHFYLPALFYSQFFMMSIMNERIERKGEILLSTPLRSSSIIIGKALPYFIGMVVIWRTYCLHQGVNCDHSSLIRSYFLLSG